MTLKTVVSVSFTFLKEKIVAIDKVGGNFKETIKLIWKIISYLLKNDFKQKFSTNSTGLLYLIVICTGLFAEVFVRQALKRFRRRFVYST